MARIAVDVTFSLAVLENDIENAGSINKFSLFVMFRNFITIDIQK